jgi:hypothetical protein
MHVYKTDNFGTLLMQLCICIYPPMLTKILFVHTLLTLIDCLREVESGAFLR